MKNTALRAIISAYDFFSSKKRGRRDPRRLLIVSTTGVGDSLWGSPAIKALKTSALNPHLTLLTSPVGAELFKENPYIDEIFILKDPALKSCFKLLKPLRKKRFHTAYIFHLSQRPILPFIHLLRPEKIVGNIGINKGLDNFLTHPIETENVHEIQRRLNLVDVKNAHPQMELFLTKKERQTATLFLQDQNIDHSTPIIGMHPGAKDLFKQWNPKHFIKLGQRLAHEKKARILITGNKGEIALTKSIAKAIPEALSIAGKFSLREAAALIEKMDHFITGDTGPMHMACALKTPITALFSPTDPKICGPFYTQNAQVIFKEKTCFPCINKKCKSPFCLEQITPNEVFKQVTLALDTSTLSPFMRG